MNILIFNWRDIKNPKAGGAEIVTLEHAKHWIKKGNSVIWLAPKYKNSKDEEIIDGVRIVRKGNLFTVYFIAPFYYFLSKTEFDIVIDQIHGIPFFTPFFVRKPKIAFIHEVADDIWDYMYPFPFNKIGKFLERIVLIPYKKIQFFTVSNSTKKDLLKFGIQKIEVIRNGLSVKDVGFVKKEIDPTFIFVSRIVKMKGIEDVLNSFMIVRKSIPKARLWIVGKGDEDYLNRLKDSYNLSRNNSITLFGYVSEIKKLELMKKSHLLVQASVKEGWGLAVVEAAGQGTPSIVYDVPGLNESVINGKTGIIVNNNNSNELAKEMISLINDKNRYKKISSECNLYAEKLNWNKSTKSSMDLLLKVARNNNEK